MFLPGSAWGDDHIWTNNGSDRLWNNVSSWDTFLGGCGADIADRVPTGTSDWIVIESQGDPIRCLGTGNDRPSGPPYGQGPILNSSVTNASGWALILGNTLDMQPGSSFSTSNIIYIGLLAGQTGTLNLDGGDFGNNNTIKVGMDPGSSGAVNITGGGYFHGRYIAFGASGDATVQLTDGTIESYQWMVIGGEDNTSGASSTATLTMDGGYLRACENGNNFVVGDDGVGTLNVNLGVVDVQDNGGNYPQLKVAVGAGSSGIVNLNGGLLYSKGFPDVNNDGDPVVAAVINFNAGKLGTIHTATAQADIEAAITDGKFNNGVTNVYSDASWHYYQRPADYNSYVHNGDPTDIWIVEKGPACDTGVTPVDDQTVDMAPDQTVDVVYTVRNFGDVSVGYTVAESPDVSWLTLDKTSATGLAGSPGGLAGATDDVTATINTAGMTGGSYTVDLIFTDDCASANPHIRTINVEIASCFWELTPVGPIHTWADCANPQIYNYSVTNSNYSVNSLTYTVEECDSAGGAADWSWITLTKTSGGPVPPNSSDTIPVTVSATQSDTQGYIKVISTCGSDVTEEIREIRQWYQNNVAGYKHAYLGDVDPLLMDSCKHVPPDGEVSGRCLFVALSGMSGFTGKIHGTVVDDPQAQNGKAFYISTAETGRAGYGTHVNDGVNPHMDRFKAHLGTTIVGRLKVTAYSIVGAMLWTYNDSIGENPWMQSTHRTGWGGVANGKITEYHVKPTGENIVTDPLASGDDRLAYHTFRMAIGGGKYGDLVSFMCYFDEDPDPVIEVHGWWLSPAIYNYLGDRFCFGTYGGGASGDIYWDWISFTNMGMYGPGEEDDCIGTLIFDFPPPCNTPFADADNDGDVDQDDFAEFQVCYSGTAPHPDTPEYCRCFNREGADNDVDDNDFTEFEKCAGGPNIPVLGDPDCDFNP
jgi:hypothetical protein